jgi:hypothetical protein
MPTILINGAAMETVSDKLKWSNHMDTVMKKGTTATLQRQDASEIQPVPEDPYSVLQEHHREHTFWKAN